MSRTASLIAERLASWADVRAAFEATQESSPGDATGLQRPPLGAVAATPFQAGPWLDVWYAAFTDITSNGSNRYADRAAADGMRSQPAPLLVRDAQTGTALLGLPLVLECTSGPCDARFADADITDYNAPLIAKDGFGDHTPDALIAALGDALPDAHLLRFDKMPAQLGPHPNPLCALPGTLPSHLSANVLTIAEPYETYRRALPKKFRKEMERSFRVFVRDGETARFERIDDPVLADAIARQIAERQRARIQALGLPYFLDTAEHDRFFRELVARGLADGSVVVTALLVGEATLVAGLIGIRAGETYAMVRLGQDIENWSHCSPGKLVIERTLHALREDGVTVFDFTTGDYTYKQSFQPERSGLFDLTYPLSLRGQGHLVAQRAFAVGKAQLGAVPGVKRALRSLRVIGAGAKAGEAPNNSHRPSRQT